MTLPWFLSIPLAIGLAVLAVLLAFVVFFALVIIGVAICEKLKL